MIIQAFANKDNDWFKTEAARLLKVLEHITIHCKQAPALNSIAPDLIGASDPSEARGVLGIAARYIEPFEPNDAVYLKDLSESTDCQLISLLLTLRESLKKTGTRSSNRG